jgi:hypothetical protein
MKKRCVKAAEGRRSLLRGGTGASSRAGGAFVAALNWEQ